MGGAFSLRAICLVVACQVAIASGVARGDGAAFGSQVRDEAPGDSLARALLPDGREALPDSVGPGPAVRPGSVHVTTDIRRNGAREQAQVLAGAPGARLVGSGWRGHRASLARGALPASFTGISILGRRADDGLSGGTDVLGPIVLGSGRFVAATGPDLSAWPVYMLQGGWLSPGGSAAPLGGARPGLGLDLIPKTVPGHRPFARCVMGSGLFGWRTSSFEFGRRYQGGQVGLTGFFENHEGRAPEPGGSYGAAHTGIGAAFALRGGWYVTMSGLRSDVDRNLPGADPSVAPVERESIRTESDAVVTNGAHRFQLFRTSSWQSVDGGVGYGGGIESVVEGVGAALAVDRLGVDRVAVLIERRSARGALLSGPYDAIGIGVRADAGFGPADGWRVDSCAGIRSLAEEFIAEGCVLVATGAGEADLWMSLELGGRPPTVAESHLTSLTIPGVGGEELCLLGERSLRAEHAAVFSAGCELVKPAWRVGSEALLARVMRPIVLRGLCSTCRRHDGASSVLGPDLGGSDLAGSWPDDPSCCALESADGTRAVRFANGADETAASVSFWGEVQDGSGLGARCVLELYAADDDGALSCFAPLPSLSLGGTAWLRGALFQGYMDAELTVSVEHARGLARGPWAGEMDGSFTVVGLDAAAVVRDARFFVSLNNLLNLAFERWPGLASGGRTLSAGLSWDFWD